jgi:hypothetical protein
VNESVAHTKAGCVSTRIVSTKVEASRILAFKELTYRLTLASCVVILALEDAGPKF